MWIDKEQSVEVKDELDRTAANPCIILATSI